MSLPESMAQAPGTGRVRVLHMLRVSAFLVGGILCVQLLDPDLDLGGLRDEFLRNTAAVSAITTSVPQNEVNVLAQALDEKRAALDEREVELTARESALAFRVAEEVRKENRKTLFVILGTALLLLVLVLLNFYFDLRRDSRPAAPARVDGPAAPEHDHSEGDGLVTRL